MLLVWNVVSKYAIFVALGSCCVANLTNARAAALCLRRKKVNTPYEAHRKAFHTEAQGLSSVQSPE